MPFSKSRSITILMADDDEDDRLLTQDALNESRVLNRLYCVEDGVELLQYLRREGKYQDKDLYPRPGLILLDLNMPRMDGREALQEIKADPDLRSIPVVILTTSKQEEDMIKGYGSGAASYITKPVNFEGLVGLMKAIGQYWVEFVELPLADND
ncbi:MAG: response regulator [Paraglaciecola sp.]|uniref:response regulator n=1 Tax=Paraglaciecola sp. TaxID=1920173 RepID=UPI00273DF1EA|nr:response regulator [Paraglaciecola sp.]MDP5033242.1 response regulator [Paraglaciecola sp.]MDP5129595.1 response regulator [Paraglaciecola sp.]